MSAPHPPPAEAPRLSRTTLRDLPGTVARPDYDVGSVRTGIVHLGLGASTARTRRCTPTASSRAIRAGASAA